MSSQKGPSPFFPILGNIPQLIKYKAEASYETFDKLVEVYGPVVYIRFGAISQGNIQSYKFQSQQIQH